MADKKYIVSLSESTYKGELEFWKELGQIDGVTWWHWLPTTWLIVDSKNKLNVHYLTNMVENHFAGQPFLISQVKVETWRGKGTISTKKNMFDWLKKYWIAAKEPFL